uniref:Oxidored_FMN domain-containing protein n=1 Tax=Panagrellus redivivus TaxID=6233 RepID=A0A7E4WAD6_PANRE
MRMVNRIPVEKHVDPSILGETLTFPTSKRVVRNRFLKSALSECQALWTPETPATNGLPPKNFPNLYEKWCAAGYGVVITGNVMVDKNHLEAPGNTIITADTESPEKREIWTAVAKASKAQGGLLIAQLGHAGRQTPLYVNSTPFSASDVQLKSHVRRRDFGQPIELSLEQIQTEVIDKFVYTAKFFYEVGFDGIQLHGAHGYLLAQFLSGTTNKRNDKYGGNAANRARIIVDVYDAIRTVIPAETGFVIGIKLNSVEFQNEGLQTDEAVIIAEILDNAGFDFIELSGGTYEQLAFKYTRETTVKREAYFLHFASQITPAIKNAVIYLTGGFRTVPAMVAAVKDGATQGIGLGRPATQEYDLVNNLLSGKIESTIAWSPIIDPQDFTTAEFACTAQMAQAAQKSVAESESINEGVIDLTDDDTVKEFLEAQQKHLDKAVAASKEGRVVYGYVPFRLDVAQG